MNPLAMLKGGGISPSSNAATGSIDAGQFTSIAFGSSFAVGSGAKATSSQSMDDGKPSLLGGTSNNSVLLIGAGLLAVALLGAAFLISRR